MFGIWLSLKSILEGDLYMIEKHEDVKKDGESYDIVYFVCYVDSSGTYGNVEVNVAEEITHVQTVQEICRMIEENYSIKNVDLVNFFPLRPELREG